MRLHRHILITLGVRRKKRRRNESRRPLQKSTTIQRRKRNHFFTSIPWGLQQDDVCPPSALFFCLMQEVSYVQKQPVFYRNLHWTLQASTQFRTTNPSRKRYNQELTSFLSFLSNLQSRGPRRELVPSRSQEPVKWKQIWKCHQKNTYNSSRRHFQMQRRFP